MTVSNRVVNVINLGRLGFLQAYDVQLRYAHQHLDYLAGRRHAEGCDTLLLVEHNPVFTVGIRKHNLDEVRNLSWHQGPVLMLLLTMHYAARGETFTTHPPKFICVKRTSILSSRS